MVELCTITCLIRYAITTSKYVVQTELNRLTTIVRTQTMLKLQPLKDLNFKDEFEHICIVSSFNHDVKHRKMNTKQEKK